MRRPNHTVSVFKYVQCPSQTNGMPRHATTGRNLDNVMLREISHVKKGSFARAPLIRDQHTERAEGFLQGPQGGEETGRCDSVSAWEEGKFLDMDSKE